MPLYEYQCQTCDHQFEALVMGSSTTPICPSCNSTKLDKLLSTFAVSANSSTSFEAAPSPCGSCGDPRGPGACAWEN